MLGGFEVVAESKVELNYKVPTVICSSSTSGALLIQIVACSAIRELGRRQHSHFASVVIVKVIGTTLHCRRGRPGAAPLPISCQVTQFPRFGLTGEATINMDCLNPHSTHIPYSCHD